MSEKTSTSSNTPDPAPGLRARNAELERINADLRASLRRDRKSAVSTFFWWVIALAATFAGIGYVFRGCATGATSRANATREANDFHRRNFGGPPASVSCATDHADLCDPPETYMLCTSYSADAHATPHTLCCDDDQPSTNDGCYVVSPGAPHR